MTKRFGEFTALDAVSMKVTPGTFHALLGENGAGKSTLVKCIMGYYQPDDGQVLVGGHEETIDNPRAAHALGLGMVYQHFTLVPAMTVAENFVLARRRVARRHRLAQGNQGARRRSSTRMPFRVPLDAKVSAISAGERQKCEILKQLYLKRRFLILDEPTSVLTPARGRRGARHAARDGDARRADHPDDHPQVPRGDGVRRRGDHPAPRQARRPGGLVSELTPDAMARTMIGAEELTVQPRARRRVRGAAPRTSASSTRSTMPASRRCATCRSASAAARSSASPASRATASASWSRCSPASARPRAARSIIDGELYHATREEMRRAQGVVPAGGAAEERLRGAR